MGNKSMQFGIGMLLVSVFSYICTFSIKITGESIVASAVFFPRLIIGLTALLSIILFAMGLKDMKKGKEESKDTEEKNYPRLFGTMAMFIAFGLAVEMIGFVISAVVFIALQIWILDENKVKKSLIKYGIIAVCTSAFIYFVFTYAFYVSLPSGRLF